MAKKEAPKIDPDEFTHDGVRLFNPTKPHGVVYADGFHEGKWMQGGVEYRADRLPVGYKKGASKPEAPVAEPKPKPLHWTQRKKLEEAQRASGAT